MSSMYRVRDVYVSSELASTEADGLRAENQQLYRLILELVLDLNELEDACGLPLSPHTSLRFVLQSRNVDDN
jgi:hypothetical protein